MVSSKHYKGLLAFEVDLKISPLSGQDYKWEVILDLSGTSQWYNSLEVDVISCSTGARLIEDMSEIFEIKAREKVNESTMTATLRFTRKYLRYLEGGGKVSVGKIRSQEEKTTFHHQIVSEHEITTETFLTNRHDGSDSSLFVILGVAENHPVPHVSWSPGWLPSAEVNGVGTIWVSRDDFLQLVLKILADFNAETTIVRQSDSGQDAFITLKQRNEDASSKNAKVEDTHWLPEQDSTLLSSEWLAYNWHYSYDASRKEGTLIRQDLDSLIRTSSVLRLTTTISSATCFLVRTENHVWVPTENTSNSSEIKLALTGEHQIQAAQKQGGILLKYAFNYSSLINILNIWLAGRRQLSRGNTYSPSRSHLTTVA